MKSQSIKDLDVTEEPTPKPWRSLAVQPLANPSGAPF